jgi:hypothetical protein
MRDDVGSLCVCLLREKLAGLWTRILMCTVAIVSRSSSRTSHAHTREEYVIEKALCTSRTPPNFSYRTCAHITRIVQRYMPASALAHALATLAFMCANALHAIP